MTYHGEKTIAYTIEVSGDYNTYQWYHDGSVIQGQNTNTLNIEEVSSAHVGTYVLKVNNTMVTDLELVSRDFIISQITDIVGNEGRRHQHLS